MRNNYPSWRERYGLGAAYVQLTKTGDYYSWRKMETFINNIIVGKLWIDHNGRTTITNHRNKDYCELIVHAKTREVKWRHSKPRSQYDTISTLWGNTAYCVKLSSEDLSRYLNKIESVGLRKMSVCLCHYQESDAMITNISQSFPKAPRNLFTSLLKSSCSAANVAAQSRSHHPFTRTFCFLLEFDSVFSVSVLPFPFLVSLFSPIDPVYPLSNQLRDLESAVAANRSRSPLLTVFLSF